MDAVLAYQQTAAIKAALELDVFSEIGKYTTSQVSARTTGAAVRGVRILCDYLTARGHLEKHVDQYRLTAIYGSILGPACSFLDGQRCRVSSRARDVSPLPGRSGSVCSKRRLAWVGKQCTGSSDLGEVCAGDGPIKNPLARRIASELAVTSPHKVLDVAAGHRMFGIAIAQAVADAQITAVDWQAGPFSRHRECRRGARFRALPHSRRECV